MDSIHKLYDPYDKSTWFSEIDHHAEEWFNGFHMRFIKKSDNTVHYRHFHALCDDVVKIMLDCLACTHLYSTSKKISYWKGRVVYYASFVANVKLRPPKHDSVRLRKQQLKIGYSGNLDEDKCSLLRDIKLVKGDVDDYVELGEMDPEEQIISCEECYRLYGKKMIDTVKKIGVYIAKQQPREIEKLMEKY